MRMISLTSKSLGRLARVGVAAVLAAGTATAVAAPASAQSVTPDGNPRPDFYTTPAQLPDSPGRLLKSEPMPLFADGIPGLWNAQAQRIMYSSVGATGEIVPVTGVYIANNRPALGGGPRPLAVIAPGTQGNADRCAPSRSMATGVNISTDPPSMSAGYEAVSAWSLLDRGFDVIVTDYEGLGTEGQHTYVNSISEAHAVLDGARAAIAASGGRVAPDAPVVITGYSQGGGAAARAAELEAEYAPELNVKGVNAGAPPVDLAATLSQIDGTLIVGAVGYALNSFVASDPTLRPLLEEHLNATGRQALAVTSDQCMADSVLTHALQRTSQWTATGEDAGAVIARIPEAQQVMEEQRIGTVAPQVPVRLQGNLHDDVIPYEPIRQVGGAWCAGGTPVELVADATPPILPGMVINHGVPYLLHLQEANDYLADRALDRPAPSNCQA